MIKAHVACPVVYAQTVAIWVQWFRPAKSRTLFFGDDGGGLLGAAQARRQTVAHPDAVLARQRPVPRLLFPQVDRGPDAAHQAPVGILAQAIRPAGSVQFSPTRNWSVQASAAYSRNMGAHVYDAIQSGFAVSYAMPVHRGFKDESGQVELQYPIRFSAGIQQETFFNFTGGQNRQFRPYLSISLF